MNNTPDTNIHFIRWLCHTRSIHIEAASMQGQSDLNPIHVLLNEGFYEDAGSDRGNFFLLTQLPRHISSKLKNLSKLPHMLFDFKRKVLKKRV